MKKFWMIPVCVLSAFVAVSCFGMLYLSKNYTMPAKATPTLEIIEETCLIRDDYIQPTTEPPATESETVLETQPAQEEAYTMQINMATVASYHNSNADVAGWVRVSGTVINYPIMQNEDNDYYTHHAWNGASSSAGAIFADFRCHLDTSDNTIIYGHNMGNGSMFHAIKNYKTASWGWSHPYIEIASLGHRYLYKVLSCNVVYGMQGASFEYWNFVEMNRTDFRNFINGIRNTATVWYGDDNHLPRYNFSRFITLQTCNSGVDDGMRCVVFAYLVDER